MSAAENRARQPAALADLATVVLLAGIPLAGLLHVFGGTWYAPAAVTGVATGAAVAWVGSRRRWSALTVAGATVVVYFFVGGPLAHPDTTIAGVLPGLGTLRELALGSVRAWKGFVTAPTPVSAFPELVVVPLLAGLVTTVIAGSLALRVRRVAWALLPLAALLVGMILLGTARPTWPVLQGGAFGLVAVGWLAWRRVSVTSGAPTDSSGETVEQRADVARLRRRRVAGAASMIVAVGVTVVAVGPLVSGSDARYVLRDQVEPPLDLRQYASPLGAFRRYVKDQEQDVLFTVDGLPSGGRLRLAVLDSYDGTVMDVAGGDRSGLGTSGSFELAGSVFGAASGSGEGEEPTTQLAITVGAYTGVWVPALGMPTEVEFEGDGAEELGARLYVNGETGTMLNTAVLQPGDSYTVTALISEPLAFDDLVGVTPARDPSAGSQYRVDAAVQAARTFVGTESTPLEQIRLVRDRLTADGVFSDGLEGEPPSPAGHGAARMVRLLSGDRWVGNDEQFAVAATLMLRSLGYSSRVVMGFYPEADVLGPVELRGTDVHAWVEIAIEGAGWVPLDVTPDEDNVPQDQDPRSNREPQPAVIQDPPPPDEPALAPQPPLAPEQEVEEDDKGFDLSGLLRAVAMVGVPLLLLVGPPTAIVLAKKRRRRRRRFAPYPSSRVSGGWREVTDTAIDLGAPVKLGATRHETATELHGEYGGALLLAVAQRADHVVFGEGEPSAADVEAFWSEVDTLLGELRGTSPWRRLAATFSVRSLRLRQEAVGRAAGLAQRVRGGRS